MSSQGYTSWSQGSSGSSKASKYMNNRKLARTKRITRKRVPLPIQSYVRRQIDRAIEDKYDTTPLSAAQTFACYSSDTTPAPDVVSSGHLTLPALPSFTQGVGNGGEVGQYIGNEIKLKKMYFDVTMYPQTNGGKYGRLIKVFLIQLVGANANSQFDVEDCFENDYVLDSLNNANYADVFYLTPRNTLNDNYKSVYKVLKVWTVKIPDNISAVDGANWVKTERFVYDFKGKKIRYDASGNPLNYDCRMIFTTDVGNDGTAAVSPAMTGTIATAGLTGVSMLYKRKNYYEDA